MLDRGTSDFRDPKVFGPPTAAATAWVMAVVEAVDRQILVFRSPDLRSWEHASTLGPYGPEPEGACGSAPTSFRWRSTTTPRTCGGS